MSIQDHNTVVGLLLYLDLEFVEGIFVYGEEIFVSFIFSLQIPRQIYDPNTSQGMFERRFFLPHDATKVVYSRKRCSKPSARS